MKFELTKHFVKVLPVTLALFSLTACDKRPVVGQKEEVLRPVRTLLVEDPSSGPYKEFTAVVDASQKVDLAFKVSGRIIDMPVKAGDEIPKGQLVAALDDTDIKVQVSEAQSSYDKAKSDFERAKGLITTKSISQADFDQLKAQFQSSSAQLESAQNKLTYTRLYASFDGVIAKRYVENFQEINAQAPIVALHDLNNINFKVDIPESLVITSRRDDSLPTVTANFTSIPDTEFDLEFKEISTQADEVTKTYQVTFTMPNPQSHTILPGMSARVRVILPDAPEVSASYYLPAHAVLKDNQGHYVFTVAQIEQGKGQISKQAVTIGNITALGIEVFSGLDKGQHVVTAGMSKVNDGMLVKFQR